MLHTKTSLTESTSMRLYILVVLIGGPLCGADTPKEDALYCDFYWAVKVVYG